MDETQHQMELDPENGMKLMQLLMAPDKDLENVSLADWFDEDYFESNMWKDFSTKLAFQKWDSAMEMKQYIHRFLHLGEGSELHKGILHFKYNEYDSLGKPIVVYLEKQGVQFKTSTEVTGIALKDKDGKTTVTALTIKHEGKEEAIALNADDYVFLTSGSMIQNTAYGDTHTVAPVNGDKQNRGCFTLWDKLAAHDEKFGHPEKFISDVDKTQWISFSLTIRDYPELIQTMEKLTSDYDGCAGLMTFKDSSWCLSTYVQHQPFFPEQPENVQFIWNYGLHPWNVGDYVKKPMNECSPLYVFAHLICLLHGGRVLHLARFIHAAADKHALLLRAAHAGGIAAQTGQCGVGGGNVLVRHGDNIVEILVLHFQPARHRAVDDGLELRIDGIEINGAGHDDHVRVDHLLQHLGHIVLVGTFAVVRAAIVAAGAGGDLLRRYADDFDLIAAFLRAAGELAAQQVGIAALARAAGQDQHLLIHDRLLLPSRLPWPDGTPPTPWASPRRRPRGSESRRFRCG